MTPRETVTASETVARIHEPIQRYSRSWMLAPSTDRYGVELGFATGAQFWVVGRAGVLGSCPAEVAASALAFEPLHQVRAAWDTVPAGLTHHDVALHYRSVICTWGERALAGFDVGLLGLVDRLGRRVVDAAPGCLGPLFAGWRALDAPEPPGARVALTLHLLRELRGAAHVAAILACGLTPLDAILAATHAPPRTGPAYAERMGWVGPFRDPGEVREQRVRAEALTASVVEPYFGSLDPVELAALASGVEQVCSGAS